MSLIRKLAGETAIYGFSFILSRILHYILFTWYLTRVFENEQDQYGIYRDLYFYVAVFLVILTFRMETTYFRYAKEKRAEVTLMSMIWLALFSGTFLLLVYGFSPQIASMLQYDGMTDHIMLLASVLLFDALSAVPFAILRQQNRPWRFLALKLGGILLNVSFVLFFLEILPLLAENGGTWKSLYDSHDKLYFVFLGNLLASLVVFVFLIPILRKQPLKWDFTFFKKMLAYAWPLVLVAIAGVINQSSAITFQKLLLTNDLKTNLAEGGVYTAAASLAILLNLFTVAFNYAAEPFFFAHKDRENARKTYADVALVFTIVGSMMMLVILGYMDAVQLLLGKSYRSGLAVVPILLLSYLLLGVYYNISAWYKLADKTLWGAWIAIGGTAITIIGNIIFLPSMGIIGSAWVALACYVFMSGVCYLLGQQYYPVPYNVKRMLGWMLGALAVFGLMELIRPFTDENVILIFAINTILIGLYAFLIYRLELPLVRQILRKK
jgi:O-antigen/teichoic acid export membrane protein